MAATNILENGLTISALCEQAMRLFIRVLDPTKNPTEVDDDDPGMIAIVRDFLRMDEESNDAEIKITVADLGNRCRDIYRDTHRMGESDPKPREMKAWMAVARFLGQAVQSEEEADAAAAYDMILEHEQQESADA